jgi:hypothetical protein
MTRMTKEELAARAEVRAARSRMIAAHRHEIARLGEERARACEPGFPRFGVRPDLDKAIAERQEEIERLGGRVT